MGVKKKSLWDSELFIYSKNIFLSLYPEKDIWTIVGDYWVVGLDALEGKETKLEKKARDSESGWSWDELVYRGLTKKTEWLKQRSWT